MPGYVASAIAYRNELGAVWRVAIVLGIASALGSLIGAVILIRLDNQTFARFVPWLLLASGPMDPRVGGAGVDELVDRRDLGRLVVRLGVEQHAQPVVLTRLGEATRTVFAGTETVAGSGFALANRIVQGSFVIDHEVVTGLPNGGRCAPSPSTRCATG